MSVHLIHMNGRIYDPTIARFLSADPIIQAPSDLQSYNRYAYVRNNPLRYTDPSGYSWLSREWKRAKKRWTRIRDGVRGFMAGGYLGGVYGYNYRKARDMGYSVSQAQKVGGKAAAVTGAAVGIGFLSCGPACAVKAAATAYVMQTPTARSATQSISKEFFHDFLGIGDTSFNNFMASTVLSAGVDLGVQAAYDSFMGVPKVKIGENPINPNDPKYAEFLKNEGSSKLKGKDFQGNISVIAGRKGGQVFELLNESGDVVGLMGSSPADWGVLTVTHTASVVRSPTGQFFNSMRGIYTGSGNAAFNLYGVTGVCHQMTNSAITSAGYSGSVLSLMSGAKGSIASQVLYGQHMGVHLANAAHYDDRY